MSSTINKHFRRNFIDGFFNSLAFEYAYISGVVYFFVFAVFIIDSLFFSKILACVVFFFLLFMKLNIIPLFICYLVLLINFVIFLFLLSIPAKKIRKIDKIFVSNESFKISFVAVFLFSQVILFIAPCIWKYCID